MGTESLLPRRVFVTGGTGYLGQPLVQHLVARGHTVRVLVRPGSEGRVPPGAVAVPGDALRGASYAEAIDPGDTIVHLVGTRRPAPWKAAEFERVDWRSVDEMASAAMHRGAGHVVYLSVAHPAPTMRAYVGVRVRGEQRLRATGIPFTALRPWYVLGPGHRWPVLLAPGYALGELVPSWRAGARRLGLVTLPAMVRALVQAVEQVPARERIVEVPEIRASTS